MGPIGKDKDNHPRDLFYQVQNKTETKYKQKRLTRKGNPTPISESPRSQS